MYKNRFSIKLPTMVDVSWNQTIQLFKQTDSLL